jgi:signal transduction histidine kinase
VPEEAQDFSPLLDLADTPEDFGEILRHEMNNPLTGILGNAELLLARREDLPVAAVRRLETIADLAMRLRETIRRLSSAWEARQRHGSSA